MTPTQRDRLDLRFTTYHRTALGKATPAELGLVKRLFASNAYPLMSDEHGAMIPVAVTLGALQRANDPDSARLIEYLEALKAEDVSWLVMDAKTDGAT